MEICSLRLQMKAETNDGMPTGNCDVMKSKYVKCLIQMAMRSTIQCSQSKLKTKMKEMQLQHNTSTLL